MVAHVLTKDHKSDDPAETQLIESLGKIPLCVWSSYQAHGVVNFARWTCSGEQEGGFQSGMGAPKTEAEIGRGL